MGGKITPTKLAVFIKFYPMSEAPKNLHRYICAAAISVTFRKSGVMMLTKRMTKVMLTMQEEHTVWISLGSLPTLPENWTTTEARYSDQVVK